MFVFFCKNSTEIDYLLKAIHRVNACHEQCHQQSEKQRECYEKICQMLLPY